MQIMQELFGNVFVMSRVLKFTFTGSECGKKWTPKVFAVFLATVWSFNSKFYSFIE